MGEDDHSLRRRALSPDAQLLSHLTEIHLGKLENELANLCEEEAELIANGGHAAALALKRVEVVRLEDEIARARVAVSYRNPDN
jgi:hypothetical protein